MKLTRLALLSTAALGLALAFPLPASADQNCAGIGACNQTDSHAITANGGQGGQGGSATGGNAQSGSISGAAAINGPISNRNSNANSNRNTAVSGSKSEVKNSGNSANWNSNSARQGQDQGQIQGQGQGQAIIWENPRPPVNSAMAAALTASPETCAGSSSIGGQGVGFGLSIGSTWESEQCNRRRNALTLSAMNNAAAAVELMCQDEEVRAAMKAAGTPCAADREAQPVASLDDGAIRQSLAQVSAMEPIPNDQ